MGLDSPSRKWVYTRSGAQRVSTLREHKLSQKKDERVGAPTKEEMRECIKNQWCWWCDSGPWKSLSQHTSHAHGIMAGEIRELAHLYKRAIICSPEQSQVSAIHFQNLLESGKLVRPDLKGHVFTPHFSSAGYEAVVEHAKISVKSPKFINGAKQYHENSKCAHKCPACGIMIPTARPVHCSPECALITTSEKLSKPNPKLSATLKQLYSSGKLKLRNPQPPKSHHCPICGAFIKYSHPLTCSPECAKASTRQKVTKPHPCPVCGTVVATSSPITCSPACRKIIRQRTGAASRAKINARRSK